MTDKKIFMLKNVRASFPSIFEKGSFNGEENNAHEITALLDKPKGEHKKIGASIAKAVAAAIKSELKGKKPKAKYCAWKDDKNRDILENNREEYEGCFTLKAKNKLRVPVIDGQRQPVTQEDGLLFAGCRVNMKVELNVYMNKQWGPIVGFKLLAIQVIKSDDDDAQPFGEAPVNYDDAVDGFDDIEEEDDDIMGDDEDDDDDDYDEDDDEDDEDED